MQAKVIDVALELSRERERREGEIVGREGEGRA